MSDEQIPPPSAMSNVVSVEEFRKQSQEKKKERRKNDRPLPLGNDLMLKLIAAAQGFSAKNGALSIENIQDLIIAAGFNLSYNEVLMRCECNNQIMHDGIHGRIINRMREIGELAGEDATKALRDRRVIQDAITDAHYRRVTNPIQTYLSLARTQHAEGRNFEYLCSFFEDDDQIFRTFFRKWMLGCVAREFDNFQNYVLVLQGAQGIGKSTFASWLCKGLGFEYFQEGVILPREKDHKLRLSKKFLWLSDEFGDTMSRSNQNELKAFVTQDTISERPAYGHNEIIARRHCNIIATTNDEKFLRDITGNRRYLVVNLKALHMDYSRSLTPEMVWGDIMETYARRDLDEDNSPVLSMAERGLQSTINAESSEDSSISDFLDQLLVFDENEKIPSINIQQPLYEYFKCDRAADRDFHWKRAKDILLNKWKVRMAIHNGRRVFMGITLRGKPSGSGQ